VHSHTGNPDTEAAGNDSGRLPQALSFRDAPFAPEMVIIPAGVFFMGSPEDEQGRQESEGPRHKVTIPRPFAAGRFAVTFAEWDAAAADGCCGGYSPPDNGWGRGRRPVISVSRDDAQAYLAWLREKTGKAYRLLSEAEWEYAGRAGTDTPFWWGSQITPELANYDGNCTYAGSEKGRFRDMTVPVDHFHPNPSGLHQMHGNVWEWVEDCWIPDYWAKTQALLETGGAVTSGASASRIRRGGSWMDSPVYSRAAARIWNAADSMSSTVGFRAALTL
jgi:formylglycine-generating enzyme required for sulfatase activity